MKDFIIIDDQHFYFEKQDLFHGQKAMDIHIATNNLQKFHAIVHPSGVRYGLIFGTLLGAIREKGFITHDEDTDVFLLEEDKEAFFRLLPALKEKGLEVIRYPGPYISLMCDNEYIDVYFFVRRRKLGNSYVRVSREDFEIKAEYLENAIEIPFLGMNVFVPSQPEKVLETLYGKNWQIPLKDKFAEPNSINSKISRFIRRVMGSELNFKFKEDIKRIMSRL